jgi:hypothetical protein
MGALTDYLTGSDEIFKEYARLVAQVTCGRRACELLGLANHPSSLEKAKQGQDKQHWRVVYHSDTWTKYSMPAPPIETNKPDTQPLHGAIGPGHDQ